MPCSNNYIRKGISILFIIALNITGLFSCHHTAYADTVVLSEQVYHHLDMGVQIAYNPGCDWGSDNTYGSPVPLSVNTTITFNNNVEVLDTYPLNSAKGNSFDFHGETSSHNIPNGLGEASWAYGEYYSNYVSTSMTEGTCSNSGKNVFFNYTARLGSSVPLEVVKYGEDGNDQEIYRLFGGKSALQDDQPEIAEAIETALTAGANGTAGTNKLYLIFCPNVIEYKKYITIGDLEARLDLPTSAKQGETYTAADTSLVDDSLTVDFAVLEKHYGDGIWEEVITWNGTGSTGGNTGGSIEEAEDEIRAITYRLTVTTTNDQVDTDTKTIRITDGRDVEGEAILELPAFTYEGHPALARDVSVFTVDGVDYSARRAYEEDIASNRFRPLPSGSGSAVRESLTTANVVFPSRGNYNVRLEVDTVDCKELTDTKPIEVRKTPYIIDNLGGFQKQNRKQILNISVATYPGKPITDYSIKLRDLKTGEEITLTKDMLQENSNTIKTRTHSIAGDQYWTEYRLEFLTKTPAYDPEHPDATQEFRYTIYMKDSKGDTDTVQKTFTVAPDLPPNAQITIQDSFIRNKGTNIAEIEAEDSSTTDGDQVQRTWTSRGTNVQALPGFQDNSFGSRQKVQYNKTGVGKEMICLLVKDVWTEPTLEEYITEADYLSAATTAVTDVVNIAPTVRLEPIETETADIAILTEKVSESGIKAGINSLKAALIEAGIDAKVQVIPTAKPNSDGYHLIGAYDWKIAINDQTQQSASLVFDSEYAYVIEAAGFQMSGYQEIAIPPYTVRAVKKSESGNGLVTAWSYTVTDSTNFRLKTDSAENYIYLACYDTGKTVLLNRNNGAYVTTLPVVIPDNPFTSANNNNLYFLNSSSIQKYDPDTGSLKTVTTKGGSLGRIQNGKLTFVGSESSHKFYIGQFDMNTETITQKSIPELEEYVTSESKTSISPTDMDPTGKVTFTQVLIDDNNDRNGVILWLADAEAQRVYHLSRVASPNDMRTNSVGFVKDETGKAVYMYHAIHDDNSTTSTTRKYFHLYVYTLGDGEIPPVKRTIYSENNKRNNGNGISYAKYHSQENAIYLMQGAEWEGYDWGGNVWGVNARIQLPSWSVNLDQYDWGWDVADEYGSYNDYLMMTYYNYDNWVDNDRRIKMFTNSVTKEQAEEAALTRLADFTQTAARHLERNFTGIPDLLGKVKEAVKKKTSLKLAAASSGEVSLSRSFMLKPGQTYYYEYEVKKPAAAAEEEHEKVNVTVPQITFDTQNVYQGSENLESYYVTDIIEEDFNGELNPFFTLDSGRITNSLQTPTTQKYGSSRDLATASQVSFTIPEGKTAVAIMDVEVYHDSLGAQGWRSGAYINGQRYDSTPMSGNPNINEYVHPYPLKPGVNTITAYVCDRTRQLDSWYTKIDNLKILFLDDASPAAGGNFSSTITGDGWTKVTGSFQAPLKITEFQSQPMEHYPDFPPGLSTSVNGNYTYYDFVIPPEKTAKMHATFQGGTSRDNTSAGTFSFPGWSVSHRGTRSSNNGLLTYVSSGDTYFSGNFQGSPRITLQAGYQRWLSFSKLETYVYPDNLKDRHSFFFSDGKVYSMSNTFNGDTNISINLNFDEANSELLMQNLKIYYLNNGSKIYLYNKPLQDSSELSGWELTANAAADLHTETKPEKEEDAPLVYKKGQLVSYNIFYDDYENDPSKKQYWRYAHTPYNDGPHPQAAYILDEYGNVVSSTGAILSQSIPRFYIDGKYTVEHWQEDNTNRGGEQAGPAGGEQEPTDYTLYDKLSNIETITFYIEGGATAPWITFIKTIPAEVKEGDLYRLQIGVDDAEKDPLRLTTELYKDKKLIYTHRQTDILADAGGVYPEVTTGCPPTAEPGIYEAVCTVRDWTGVGIGSYRFTVISEGKITGFVNHTDQWEQNRKKYNLKRFSEEGNSPMQLNDYIAMPTPRLRGTNVFWSGEKFMLRSETEGKPLKIDVEIYSVSEQGVRKSTGFFTELTRTGSKTAAGAELWEGSLWENGMINRWGRRVPEQLLFVFTASYAGGAARVDEVMVLVDSRQDYWQLHRLW